MTIGFTTGSDENINYCTPKKFRVIVESRTVIFTFYLVFVFKCKKDFPLNVYARTNCIETRISGQDGHQKDSMEVTDNLSVSSEKFVTSTNRDLSV